MFKSVQEFYKEAGDAGKKFDHFVTRYGLRGVIADHICYKCDSPDSFERARRVFETDCEWMYQAIISKRRVATIKTLQGLGTSAGTIRLVELSDQKPDRSQTEGFDHIEIYPNSGTYDQLVDTLKARGVEVNEVVRPHHTTHDIRLESGLIIRLSRESLAEKIKKEQM